MIKGERIRILYCENNVDGTIGGSYYSLYYLVKGLDRARFDPIVVFYTNHRLLPLFRAAGVETLVWSRAKPFTFGVRGGAAMRWLRPAALALQKALNLVRGLVVPALIRAWFLVTHRVSIVHLNNSVLYNHDWMLAALLTRRRCLTHERGINDAYPAAAKYLAQHLDAVICISDAVKANMKERGADFGNLITIYNGLDPAEMRLSVPSHELRAALGLQNDAPVVGMIGNIRAWKGQETLVRAIDQVRRRCPAVRCVLVGDVSPADLVYEQVLRGLVSALDLDRHVVFAGYQRNVADFLMMFDVVVHASVRPEPFGRVILEGMACRKPVVAARAGAIPEIIEHGHSGLTFAPGDADELAAAIARVLGDRETARSLGENAYRRLLERFHVRRNIDETQQTYERLLRATR